jgi:aminopeptidase N
MPTAEITRAETRERARLLDVDDYLVELDLTCGDEVFGSVSVVRFGCRQPGAATYADLVAEQVREIMLNGVRLDPAAVYSEGRIALAGLAQRNELRVAAVCRYASDGTAMHRTVDSADGRVYLYTKFEPAAARRVFANFEQPDLKASFAFTIIAPEHWTVLSCQPAPDPEPAGPGTAVWRFGPTPRISTYLTEVVAGEYHYTAEVHTTPGGQVIPLGVACRVSLAESLDAADIFDATRRGLDYYTGLFQSDYPFAKYDQVFVPEFSAGAMENVGCVTIAERLIFRSRVTDTMYERRTAIVLHEMAHMWFGDLVTMRWFDDLWLNESFADYCAALSSAEATRFADAWTTFAGARKSWGYQQDQLPSTHPIAADVPTVTAAVANFDGISYAKGAAVLKQLAAYLGRGPFFAGIRAYLAAHAWGNATLADLLMALEESSGRDLSGWSKVWLETAGPNTLRPDLGVGTDARGGYARGGYARGGYARGGYARGGYARGGYDRIGEFAVLQEAPAAHPTLRPHRIAIGCYERNGGKLVRTSRVELDVSGPRTAVPSLVGQIRPELILLNDDDLGYALIRFDELSLHTVAESISDIADPLARTICWTAVLDMVRQAELAVPAFTAMLALAIGTETAVTLLQLVLGFAEDVAFRVLADPRVARAGRMELAGVAVRLLAEAEPGSDLQLTWVQLLSWTATNDDQLELLAGLLGGDVRVDGLAIDTDLRWDLLRRLAATGRAGDARIDAELDRDPTDDGRRNALACRAAIADAGHKEAAWRLLTESGELGFDTAIIIGQAFNQSEQPELLAPYTDRYFEQLPELWQTRSHQSRLVLGQVLFPYTASPAALLAKIEDFLGSGARDPGLVRLLAERSDLIERTMRSRALTSS